VIRMVQHSLRGPPNHGDASERRSPSHRTVPPLRSLRPQLEPTNRHYLPAGVTGLPRDDHEGKSERRCDLDAERGLTPGGINLRARTINSYLAWLHEEGNTPERFRIKLLKNPPKPIQALTDKEIQRLVAFRPNGRIQLRTWVLAMLLLDCGLRIGDTT